MHIDDFTKTKKGPLPERCSIAYRFLVIPDDSTRLEWTASYGGRELVAGRRTPKAGHVSKDVGIDIRFRRYDMRLHITA
uniref:Uncharacterized protein n=1 Tax=Romanomermis culicivorax TaxID=13658 RepID=A0A915K1T7_ROMCU